MFKNKYVCGVSHVQHATSRTSVEFFLNQYHFNKLAKFFFFCFFSKVFVVAKVEQINKSRKKTQSAAYIGLYISKAFLVLKIMLVHERKSPLQLHGLAVIAFSLSMVSFPEQIFTLAALPRNWFLVLPTCPSSLPITSWFLEV